MRVFPHRSPFLLPAALAVGTVFLVGLATSQALQISEYFNDYGTTNTPLTGLNGGTGWNSAWAGSGVTFIAGTQTNYAATGYSGAGNQTDTNDGSISGSGTGTLVYRTFSPLTGTIWISVTTLQTALAADVLLWLDKDATNGTGTSPRNFAALRGSTLTDTTNNPTKIPEPLFAYGSDDGASNRTMAINTPHLLLLKIDMNFSGTFDRVSWWVDPDLSTGQAGLGTTVGSTNGPVYLKDTADAYGADFTGIGLSTSGSTQMMDAIRISNDADGFTFVTTPVPEPASVGLLALGAALLGQRRRRPQERTV